MAFMGLVFIGIAMLMIAVSVVCLVLAMILFLVNRFRRRRGKEPKKLVRIAGIVFLVIGILNGAPILFLCIINGVRKTVGRVQEGITERKMPERAVFYDEDSMNLYLKYKGEKYALLGLEADKERIKLSEGKAYIRFKTEDRLSSDILYEVESEPYDLLYDDEAHLYCKEEDADSFMKAYHASSTYYLSDDEEWEKEVQLEDLGVKEKEREKLTLGPDFEDYIDVGVEYSLTLYESGMNGKFRGVCTYLEGPDSEGNWYLRRDVGQWWEDGGYEHMDSAFLPEKGCRYMDSLMEER